MRGDPQVRHGWPWVCRLASRFCSASLPRALWEGKAGQAPFRSFKEAETRVENPSKRQRPLVSALILVLADQAGSRLQGPLGVSCTDFQSVHRSAKPPQGGSLLLPFSAKEEAVQRGGAP